jgi:hypothetical protein
MSKTQLQSNNARLASLIEELRGKAAGGGGGGSGSIETCTVTINCFSNIRQIVATVLENGVITPYGEVSIGGLGYNTCTIENVVCGSAIFFSNGYELNGYTLAGGVEFFYTSGGTKPGAIFRAPLTEGANATITVFDND